MTRPTRFDHARLTYGVPARLGARVSVDGQSGVITSAKGPYIMVRFDGHQRPLPCHPTWRVIYHDQKETT